MKCLPLLIISCFLFFNLALAINPSCIDINTAPKEELQKITGIGPVLAQRIIDARPFSSIEELIKVSGIGEIKLANIKEQNLACVQSQPKLQTQPQLKSASQPQKQPENNSQQSEQPEPKLILSYSQDNPVNREIEVTLSVSNLKKTAYDVKISIEKEGKTFSNIYNKDEDKWQSSRYYLNNLFSGSSFEQTLKLKIREENLNFEGEADISVRLRENGKSNYLEDKGKINLTKPERQEEQSSETESSIPTKNLATIGQQISGLSSFPRPFLIALGLAIFSGALILTLKKRIKPEQ